MRWRLVAAALCLAAMALVLVAMFIHEPDDSRRPNAPTFTVAQVQQGLVHHRAQWANRTVWLHAWLGSDCPSSGCGLGQLPDEPRHAFTDRAGPLPFGYLEDHGLALGNDEATMGAGAPGWIAGLPLFGEPLAQAWPARTRGGMGYYRVQLYSTLGIGCNRYLQPWCSVALLKP